MRGIANRERMLIFLAFRTSFILSRLPSSFVLHEILFSSFSHLPQLNRYKMRMGMKKQRAMGMKKRMKTMKRRMAMKKGVIPGVGKRIKSSV